MKILILGHARHGKDTVAKLLQQEMKLRFIPTSMYIAKHIIYPHFQSKYKNVDECYEDRVNNRELWFNLINEYSKYDPSRLVKEILKCSDIYVGLRCKKQFNSVKHLFDVIIWVSRHKHAPKESISSCTVHKTDANILLNNNKTLRDLKYEVQNICKQIYK